MSSLQTKSNPPRSAFLMEKPKHTAEEQSMNYFSNKSTHNFTVHLTLLRDVEVKGQLAMQRTSLGVCIEVRKGFHLDKTDPDHVSSTFLSRSVNQSGHPATETDLKKKKIWICSTNQWQEQDYILTEFLRRKEVFTVPLTRFISLFCWWWRCSPP